MSGTRVPRSVRREQLLDVALELILRDGFGALSMQGVAVAARVSKPIVYRSFSSAPVLLAALLRREQRRADRALARAIPDDPGDAHPADVLMAALEALIEAALEHPLTWRLVLMPPEGTPRPVRMIVERRRSAVVRRTTALVAWGLRELRAGAETPDPELVARAIVSAAQEQTRMVLEDPASAPAVLAATRTLLGAVAWKA